MLHLLDTSAYLRFISEHEGPLGREARRILVDAGSEIGFTPLSAMELEVSQVKGRRSFPAAAISDMRRIAASENWMECPFDGDAALHLSALFHAGIRDPFDVMIAATAISRRAVLVTCDRRLAALRMLKTIW